MYEKTNMSAEQGLRVVRGEGWKHDDQDGGEGNVGTVVLVKSEFQRMIANVIWDNGMTGCYEIGNEIAPVIVAHDARQNGVDHRKACSECGESIVGPLWNCHVCRITYLCSFCYMNDSHDVMHPFKRKLGNDGSWVLLPERRRSTQVTSKGLFPGATVECTSSLRKTVLRNAFQSLDDSYGRVINYESCIGNSFSAVCVVWNHNLRQVVHQLGRDGKVEVRSTVAAYGPKYYRGHLPGLFAPAEYIPKSRCYTTSQIPLHLSLQYASLQMGLGQTKDNVTSYDQNQPSAQGKASGNHRYTKSSTIDTNPLKRAGEAAKRAPESCKIVSELAPRNPKMVLNCRNPNKNTRVDKEDKAEVRQYGMDSNKCGVLAVNQVQTRNSALCVIKASIPSHRNEMNERMKNAGQDAFMIGDDVSVKTTQNIAAQDAADCAASWKSNTNVTMNGKVQYIDEKQGLCFVYFSDNNAVLKIPFGSLTKVDENELGNCSHMQKICNANEPRSFHGNNDASDNDSSFVAMGNKEKKIKRKSLPLKLYEKEDVNDRFESAAKVNSLSPKCSLSQTNFQKDGQEKDICLNARGARSISGNSDDSGLKGDDTTLCCLCQECECDVRFEPCGHLVTCSGCSSYFKKCYLCKSSISSWETIKGCSDCMLCNSSQPLVTFLPCKHEVACEDCSLRQKQCIECKITISERIGKGGYKIKMEKRWESFENLMSSVDRLRSKVMAIECKSKCQICSLNSKNVFFQCGHATCEGCGDNLIVCPVCHVQIEVKTLHAC